MSVKASPQSPAESSRYFQRFTAFDWLVMVGGLINLGVVSVIIGYAIFL